MNGADHDAEGKGAPHGEAQRPEGSPGDAGGAESALRADPKLLELLICPVSRTRLDYDAARQELISRAAGLAYPIRNGVPMMAVAAARTLDDSDVVPARPQ